jgi:hypothetical protein
MTKSELNRFHAILTAKVAELERFTHHRHRIGVERSADKLQEIQAASQPVLAVCDLDREFREVRDANAALPRIEEGSFGTYQGFEEDILAAVPWRHTGGSRIESAGRESRCRQLSAGKRKTSRSRIARHTFREWITRQRRDAKG